MDGKTMSDDFDRRAHQMQVTFIVCAVLMVLLFFSCALCSFLYRRRMNHLMYLRSQQQAQAETIYHPPPESHVRQPPMNQSQTFMQPYPDGLDSDTQKTHIASAPQLHDLSDSPPPYESLK